MPEVVREDLDALIGQLLVVSEAFASETRARLVEAVMRGDPVEDLLGDYVKLMAELRSEGIIAGHVLGWREVANRIEWPVPIGAFEPSFQPFLPFGTDEPMMRLPLIENAARDLLDREIMMRADFDLLNREARAEAFTVAYQESEDAISTIRDVLADQVSEGASLSGFRSELAERLESSQLGPAHLETVYRTNVQTAFHKAHDQLAADPVVSELFPYAEYIPVRDGRTEEEHAALGLPTPTYGDPLGIDGTNVYRADDPFWDVFRIPWRYN